MPLFINERDVSEILTMDLALETVEQAFRLMGEGTADNHPRARISLPKGPLNFMCAAAPGAGVMGLKVYGVIDGLPGRPYVQLISTDTGELLALMEAGVLGQVRTGAASGIATKYMAKEDSTSVGIIGSGQQAQTQLEAICNVRKINEVKVFSRTSERRELFAKQMTDKLGTQITPVNSAEDCVRNVDIIITITSTSKPVLSGEWIPKGAHINAAGANNWTRLELDNEAIKRSNIIVADDVEQAKLECGDLLYPIERGVLRWDQVSNLSDVVNDRVKGRSSNNDITLFESQGLGIQVITTGLRIYEIAKEVGKGSTF